MKNNPFVLVYPAISSLISSTRAEKLKIRKRNKLQDYHKTFLLILISEYSRRGEDRYKLEEAMTELNESVLKVVSEPEVVCNKGEA